jgi:hypothetical protein
MTTQVRVMTPMGAGVRAPTLQHRIVTVSAPTTAASNTTTVRLTTVSPQSFAITACKHDSLVSRSYLRKNGDTFLNLVTKKPQYLVVEFGDSVVMQSIGKLCPLPISSLSVTVSYGIIWIICGRNVIGLLMGF